MPLRASLGWRVLKHRCCENLHSAPHAPSAETELCNVHDASTGLYFRFTQQPDYDCPGSSALACGIFFQSVRVGTLEAAFIGHVNTNLFEEADEAGFVDVAMTLFDHSACLRWGEVRHLDRGIDGYADAGGFVCVQEMQLNEEFRGKGVEARLVRALLGEALGADWSGGSPWSLCALRFSELAARSLPERRDGELLLHTACISAAVATCQSSTGLLPIHLELVFLASLTSFERIQFWQARELCRLGFGEGRGDVWVVTSGRFQNLPEDTTPRPLFWLRVYAELTLLSPPAELSDDSLSDKEYFDYDLY